jgi:hypothetical protein
MEVFVVIIVIYLFFQALGGIINMATGNSNDGSPQTVGYETTDSGYKNYIVCASCALDIARSSGMPEDYLKTLIVRSRNIQGHCDRCHEAYGSQKAIAAYNKMCRGDLTPTAAISQRNLDEYAKRTFKK